MAMMQSIFANCTKLQSGFFRSTQEDVLASLRVVAIEEGGSKSRFLTRKKDPSQVMELVLTARRVREGYTSPKLFHLKVKGESERTQKADIPLKSIDRVAVGQSDAVYFCIVTTEGRRYDWKTASAASTGSNTASPAIQNSTPSGSLRDEFLWWLIQLNFVTSRVTIANNLDDYMTTQLQRWSRHISQNQSVGATQSSSSLPTRSPSGEVISQLQGYVIARVLAFESGDGSHNVSKGQVSTTLGRHKLEVSPLVVPLLPEKITSMLEHTMRELGLTPATMYRAEESLLSRIRELETESTALALEASQGPRTELLNLATQIFGGTFDLNSWAHRQDPAMAALRNALDEIERRAASLAIEDLNHARLCAALEKLLQKIVLPLEMEQTLHSPPWQIPIDPNDATSVTDMPTFPHIAGGTQAANLLSCSWPTSHLYIQHRWALTKLVTAADTLYKTMREIKKLMRNPDPRITKKASKGAEPSTQLGAAAQQARPTGFRRFQKTTQITEAETSELESLSSDEDVRSKKHTSSNLTNAQFSGSLISSDRHIRSRNTDSTDMKASHEGTWKSASSNPLGALSAAASSTISRGGSSLSHANTTSMLCEVLQFDLNIKGSSELDVDPETEQDSERENRQPKHDSATTGGDASDSSELADSDNVHDSKMSLIRAPKESENVETDEQMDAKSDKSKKKRRSGKYTSPLGHLASVRSQHALCETLRKNFVAQMFKLIRQRIVDIAAHHHVLASNGLNNPSFLPLVGIERANTNLLLYAPLLERLEKLEPGIRAKLSDVYVDVWRHVYDEDVRVYFKRLKPLYEHTQAAECRLRDSPETRLEGNNAGALIAALASSAASQVEKGETKDAVTSNVISSGEDALSSASSNSGPDIADLAAMVPAGSRVAVVSTAASVAAAAVIVARGSLEQAAARTVLAARAAAQAGATAASAVAAAASRSVDGGMEHQLWAQPPHAEAFGDAIEKMLSFCRGMQFNFLKLFCTLKKKKHQKKTSVRALSNSSANIKNARGAQEDSSETEVDIDPSLTGSALIESYSNANLADMLISKLSQRITHYLAKFASISVYAQNQFAIVPMIVAAERATALAGPQSEEGQLISFAQVMSVVCGELKKTWATFIDEELAWINSFKINPKQGGVLPPIARFPVFAARLEALCRPPPAWRCRPTMVDSAYRQLGTALVSWLENVASTNEKYEKVVLMESSHFLYASFLALDVDAFGPTLERVLVTYHLSRQAYTLWNIEYEMPAIWSYWQRLDKELNESQTASSDVALLHGLGKDDLRSLLSSHYNTSKLMDHLHEIVKRLRRHLPYNFTLVLSVFELIRDEFLRRARRFDRQVAECYPHEKISITVEDIKVLFPKALPELNSAGSGLVSVSLNTAAGSGLRIDSVTQNADPPSRASRLFSKLGFGSNSKVTSQNSAARSRSSPQLGNVGPTVGNRPKFGKPTEAIEEESDLSDLD